MRAMLATRGDYGRADWERVAVKVTALLLILVTTMLFGYGYVQTLYTTRAQRTIRPHGRPCQRRRMQTIGYAMNTMCPSFIHSFTHLVIHSSRKF